MLVFTFLFSSFLVSAQDSEIGLEFGANNYIGDVVRKYDFGNSTIGGQFFVRRHINQALSYRISVGAGSIKGSDDEAFDVFSANRRASFNGNFILTDFLFEYHFLDYRDERLQQNWSPYVLFGAGIYRMEGQDEGMNDYATGIKPRFPVGVGVKFKLDRRWILGISTSAIKTSSDDLDNVSAGTPNLKDYRGGNPNDDDWMFNTSISLSYTFYRIVCFKPFY